MKLRCDARAQSSCRRSECLGGVWKKGVFICMSCLVQAKESRASLLTQIMLEDCAVLSPPDLPHDALLMIDIDDYYSGRFTATHAFYACVHLSYLSSERACCLQPGYGCSRFENTRRPSAPQHKPHHNGEQTRSIGQSFGCRNLGHDT